MKNGNKLWIIVSFIIVFAAGVIAGILLENNFLDKKPRRDAEKRRPGRYPTLDMMAEELGIDPLEMRLRNALKTGEKQATGSTSISCGLSESLEAAAEKSGWKDKRGKLPYGRGIGMGANGMMVGFPMPIPLP